MTAFIGRREFITLFGGAAAAWPLAASAQQGERMRRIGVLMPAAADDPEGQARVARSYRACAIGLDRGRNAQIDIRGPERCRRHSQTRDRIGCARARRPPRTALYCRGRCYRRPAPCRSCSLVIDPSVPV